MKKQHVLFTLLLLAIMCFAMACGSNGGHGTPEVTNSPSNTPSNAPSNTPSNTPSSTPTNSPTPMIQQVKINAVGDVFFGSHQKQGYNKSFFEYYDKYGADYPLKNVKPIFEADDFTLVNYEGTLTESTDIMDKLWNHKGRPEFVNILPAASVEGATLGNNHIMDYGPQGVSDTLANIEKAGISYSIAGDYGEVYGLYVTKDGVKIGFVSVNEHYEHEACYPFLEKGYNYLKEQGAQIIIAAPHWGDDKTHDVNDDQKAMGKYCIDLGYDIVLGCHAHIFQGIEEYKGKYIVYGMGSFCYGGNKNPADKDSMIVQLNVTLVDGVVKDKIDMTIIPCKLSSSNDKNDYCPKVIDGKEANALFDRLNSYCEGFNIRVDYNGKPVLQD